MRPRALFESFNIEAISTTDSALDPLNWHDMIAASGWTGKVVPAYRPDNVVDPEFEGFHANLRAFAAMTGEDTGTWRGYLAAHAQAPGRFQAARRHRLGSWPPHGAHRKPVGIRG